MGLSATLVEGLREKVCGIHGVAGSVVKADRGDGHFGPGIWTIACGCCTEQRREDLSGRGRDARCESVECARYGSLPVQVVRGGRESTPERAGLRALRKASPE